MVARVLRTGDLRIEFSGTHRARDGIRIHRRIQKSRPAHYAAEVPVRQAIAGSTIELTVSGRIDGVYLDADGCAVEEIKTTAQDIEMLGREPDPIHLGQAQCYAYLFALDKELPQVDVQVTYYQIESGAMVTWSRVYTLVQLKRRFDDIVAGYLEQVQATLDWQTCRDASIAALEFPFSEYRAGQRDMAVEIFRTIRDRNQLLVQAATGIGKTMGALFPAVKALADLENPLIVYLTARTTGRLAAEKAVTVMHAKGLRLKALTITAKDKICFLEERSCTPEECMFARGYYDRVADAIRSVFAGDEFSRSRIEAAAREYTVCPFELSLELIFWADCVICDYNYAFDPRVSLKRLVLENERPCIYLVDEAHNLVDRSRAMFSAQIEKQAVLALRRAVRKQLPALFKSLGKINSWLLQARKQCQQLPEKAFSQDQAPGELLLRVAEFVGRAEKWLTGNREAPFREELLNFYFNGVNFLKTADQYGEEYVTYLEQEGDNLRVKLFCRDPARRLKAAMENGAGAVFFSATLTPAGYFRRLFGCPANTPCLQIGSPFRKEHLGVFAADRISTFYRQRDATLKPLSRMLLAMVAQKKGNYLLFFPSYDYLAKVHAVIAQISPALHTVVQKPEMSPAEKAAFLEQFQARHRDTLVGFAVLGGIFGEGIDLAGDKLSGAAVVGVGLPGLSFENDLIKAYFEDVEGAGYQYAYQYPGLNRVLQAAGRVIRSHLDKGVVLLVDQRYARYSYRSILPPYWQPVKIRSREDLENALAAFWR
jgi:DNA excision repair protein ERCC-2